MFLKGVGSIPVKKEEEEEKENKEERKEEKKKEEDDEERIVRMRKKVYPFMERNSRGHRGRHRQEGTWPLFSPSPTWSRTLQRVGEGRGRRARGAVWS